jgi:PTH1 family peptidyl-tRNA hydrolase
MQLIVGLGNPGKEYEKTRHNVGFLALDHIIASIDKEGVCTTSKFETKIYELVMEGEKHLLVYPQTFMNNSGRAVKQVMNFYKLSPKDILVLHDEVDLPIGTIRFTDNSGHAGHNGIRSIIDELGTKEFRRIRIGVESRENKENLPTDAFVLQNFSKDELDKIPWEEIKNRVLFELKPRHKE